MYLKEIGGAVCGLGLGLLAMVAVAAEDAEILNIPGDAMAWETTEEGVSFAPLVGDRFVEAYMAMVRLPAGVGSPPVVKSANMFGVVLSGVMTHTAIGVDTASEVLLPAGSFYRVPAGLPRVSKCVSDTECVTFLYQDGKFDFLPMAQ